MGTTSHLLFAFLALTSLEIVLGIDNVIFISLLVERLPRARQAAARTLGLALAMATRIALLLSIVWLTRLVAPLVTVAGRGVSGRDLVLLAGGLFLIGKSVLEMHGVVEGPPPGARRAGRSRFVAVVAQIAVIDIVFSLDSVFTAVGMVREPAVMVAAIVVAIAVMMAVAGAIGAFIARHPTVKVLALAFLLLIGMALVAEGVGLEIPKGYLYFAMAFAVAVELVNMRARRRHAGVAAPPAPRPPDREGGAQG